VSRKRLRTWRIYGCASTPVFEKVAERKPFVSQQQIALIVFDMNQARGTIRVTEAEFSAHSYSPEVLYQEDISFMAVYSRWKSASVRSKGGEKGDIAERMPIIPAVC
jgi:hypothetical protein